MTHKEITKRNNLIINGSKKVRDIILNHKQGFYRPGKFENGDVHFIRISDLDDNSYLNKNTTPLIQVNKDDIQNFSVSKDDFLFARTGGAGKFCLITEDIKAIFASYLMTLSD
jgi:type I restriction enzyme S subunit